MAMQPLVCLALLAGCLLSTALVQGHQLRDTEQQHAELLELAQEDPGAAFQQWMRAHERTYAPGTEEYESRYAAWLASLDAVTTHAATNGATYRLGLTKFADWTDDEFRAAYLGNLPTYFTGENDEEEALEAADAAELEGFQAPAAVDWRDAGIVSPVKDQHANGSKCGCCWAFATVAITEMINAQYTGVVTTLSEQQLIDCDRSGYDIGCGGGGFDTGVKYIIRNGGIDTDADYPYTALDGTCDKEKNDRHVVTVDAIEALPQNDEHAMAKWVAKAPVVTAVCCGPFIVEWRLYHGGVFNPGNCEKPVDHALAVVGYGSEGGQDFWVIKNSWGATWGEAGFLRVPRNINGGKTQGQFGLAHKPARVVKKHDNPSAVLAQQ